MGPHWLLTRFLSESFSAPPARWEPMPRSKTANLAKFGVTSSTPASGWIGMFPNQWAITHVESLRTKLSSLLAKLLLRKKQWLSQKGFSPLRSHSGSLRLATKLWNIMIPLQTRSYKQQIVTSNNLWYELRLSDSISNFPSGKPCLPPSSTCLSDGWFTWKHQKYLSSNEGYLEITFCQHDVTQLLVLDFVKHIEQRVSPNRSYLAEVVVLLVLLVWWLDLPESQTEPYQVIEYFSGVARIAMLAQYMGFTTAALDIEYGMQYAKAHGKRSPMDINSNAGLVLLGWIWSFKNKYILFKIYNPQKFTALQKPSNISRLHIDIQSIEVFSLCWDSTCGVVPFEVLKDVKHNLECSDCNLESIGLLNILFALTKVSNPNAVAFWMGSYMRFLCRGVQ